MKILAAVDLSEHERQAALVLLFPDAPATRLPFPTQLFESLFVAMDEGPAPVGAVLIECLRGGAANIWGPRVERRADQLMIEDRLLLQAEQHLLAARLRIVQAFRPIHDSGSALRRFHMKRITEIWTMVRQGDKPPPAGTAGEPLGFTNQQAGISAAFQQALVRTFEGTLDCPELNGLRSPAEVIEGHCAGAPDLSHWWLATRQDQPAGVLILAPSAAPGRFDLSYFGVVPACRGQGVGRKLLEFALGRTANLGAAAVALLVDARNRPAIHLYAEYGFQTVERQHVYLRVLQLS